MKEKTKTASARKDLKGLAIALGIGIVLFAIALPSLVQAAKSEAKRS